MAERVDLVIVGGGPAGMSAAIRARRAGLTVLLADDQPAPGGQAWRAIERRAGRIRSAEDRRGLALVEAFRASGTDYRPSTEVWQIEDGTRVFLRPAGGRPEIVECRTLLLATGAQERPMPFPGWTLPGVTTLGAAQIMLKTSSQVPEGPVWIAGNGPLVLLCAVQILDAGGAIAGFLDTTPPDVPLAPPLPAALGSLPDLWRGLGWMRRLRGLPVHRGVTGLVAQESPEAPGRLAEIGFRDRAGAAHRVSARGLLVHEGVVPRWHVASGLGCALAWNAEARSYRPQTDDWAQSSLPGVFIAGDGAGIAGAAAAVVHGEIAALGVMRHLARAPLPELEGEHARLVARRARLTALRPFLDRRYPPPQALPADKTVICRCENVTAAEIRAAVADGAAGPNQAKAYTRCGMGPCQGRQCGYAVSAIIAAATGQPAGETGLYRVRPPFRPITLGDLAALGPEG